MKPALPNRSAKWARSQLRGSAIGPPVLLKLKGDIERSGCAVKTAPRTTTVLGTKDVFSRLYVGALRGKCVLAYRDRFLGHSSHRHETM